MSPTVVQRRSGKLSSAQLSEVERFAERVSELDCNFILSDPADQITIVRQGNNNPYDNEDVIAACEKIKKISNGSQQAVITGEFVGVELILDDCFNGVALVDCLQDSQKKHIAVMLELFLKNMLADSRSLHQIEKISYELSHTYEELVLLHKLSTNMKVTESNANYLQMACDSLTDIINVEGIAILLEQTSREQTEHVVAAGSGLIDINDRTATILRKRIFNEVSRGKEALLDSEVDSPFKWDWPENIKSIIAVPLFGKEKHDSHDGVRENCAIGLMVAINRLDKPDFDSTDAKLFNSVANGCAVFVQNGALFSELKGLFIGSLKALTNSIDAKDQYTRGHSERVAFISRWIAERIAEKQSLDQEKIHRIYLAGLLHDIGKMGIEETVLRKKGPLTDDQIRHIRTHPSIGAQILSEIKQMKEIVPGVLYHHERIDGNGYPEGLMGNRIPLIGKIICIADCFDAMTSKRVYRDALSVQEALEEIEKGLGTQFDETIGRIFLQSDVSELWDILQDGFADIYKQGSFAEYGAAAVGSLLR